MMIRSLAAEQMHFTARLKNKNLNFRVAVNSPFVQGERGSPEKSTAATTHILFSLESFRQWVALYGASWVEEFQVKFARHVLRARAKRVSHHQFSQIRGRQPYL